MISCLSSSSSSVDTPTILAEPYSKKKNIQATCALCRGKMWNFNRITHPDYLWVLRVNGKEFFVHREELKVVKMLDMTFEGQKIKLPKHDYHHLSRHLHHFIDGFSSSKAGQHITQSKGFNLSRRVDRLMKQFHSRSYSEIFTKFRGFDAIKFFQEVLYNPYFPNREEALLLVRSQSQKLQDKVEREASESLVIKAKPAKKMIRDNRCVFCNGRTWTTSMVSASSFPYALEFQKGKRVFAHLIELKLVVFF